VNAKLEAAYAKQKKDEAVDSERYIDFVEMLQRRVDDPMKRRSVKRELAPAASAAVPPPVVAPSLTAAQKLFEKQTFHLLIKLPKKKEHILTQISRAGGLVADILCNKVTHVISSEAEASHFQNDIDKAISLGLPVVNSEFVIDSIAEEELQDYNKYLLRCSHDAKVIAPSAASSNAEPPAAKKLKADDGALVAGRHFTGLKLVPYSYELQIDAVAADLSFTGTMLWPSLENCKTKLRGRLHSPAQEQLTFEEYECVAGANAVELPNNFTGRSGKEPALEGTYIDNQKHTGNWKMHLQRADN